MILVLVWPVPASESVVLPAGSFAMGGTGGESDELPAHRVRLGTFGVDRFEVTAAEYDSCVARGACTPAHYDDGRCLMVVGSDFQLVHVPTRFRSARRPVVCVTWQQAALYCRHLGRRLPTEAEWEYAALGGGTNTYAWGADRPTADQCVPVGNNSPAEVGEYAPNGWGLYDMTGNVWEWTADWYQRNYYAVSDTLNPTGSLVGYYRVVRGGSWYGGASQLRLRNRQWFPPSSAEVSIGFRCAK
jgi:formylglycine-generating enzyme